VYHSTGSGIMGCCCVHYGGRSRSGGLVVVAPDGGPAFLGNRLRPLGKSLTKTWGKSLSLGMKSSDPPILRYCMDPDYDPILTGAI